MNSTVDLSWKISYLLECDSNSVPLTCCREVYIEALSFLTLLALSALLSIGSICCRCICVLVCVYMRV